MSLGQLRRSPDQNIRVPDARYAEIRVCAYPYPNASDTIFDRHESRLLRETEKWSLHHVPLIPDWDIREDRNEQIELLIALRWQPPRHSKHSARTPMYAALPDLQRIA